MHVVKLDVDHADRAEIRRFLLQQWIEELPGTVGKAERYRYNVEALQDGRHIYLLRPAAMHKGCEVDPDRWTADRVN